MTLAQEEALFDFLENETGPFTLEEAAAYARKSDHQGNDRLFLETAAIIETRNLAFRLDKRQWVSRRGFFEKIPFVIRPSRLELLNGILIPGHRCIPFANPVLMPGEYEFFWKGERIPGTTSEGPPEDFYPYYNIFGEEYAPQYVAKDNPENEAAFNGDPYEDPPDVSIHTIDMRNVYRETSFVPGDRFVVRTLDWKRSSFMLEKVNKDDWDQAGLYAWLEAAEGGFEDSFALLGPGAATEEQIAYAYWYGGQRMRELPAYSLEEFLYEKTERVEIAAYGIESRFWFAGKEIPDSKGLAGLAVPPDRTLIEEILFKKNIPISEYVIISYIRNALFQGEGDIHQIIKCIVPPAIRLSKAEKNFLESYIDDILDEVLDRYTPFADQEMGPIRQRVGELHTAVVELAAMLQKGDIDTSWLPRHTFIVLSQIQGHAASLLEDLDSDEAPPAIELEAMDNSLDSMVETFGDIKELIDNAMNDFRRNNLLLVRNKSGKNDSAEDTWLIIQISISGTKVWRRVMLPGDCTLKDMHRLIQKCLSWNDSYQYRFSYEISGEADIKQLGDKTQIGELFEQDITEIRYEYGVKWLLKIIILSSYSPGKDETVRCAAGEGAAPPEIISGPLRFKKIITALENGSDEEKQAALHELGPDFVPGLFDKEQCNRNINAVFTKEK